MRGENRVTYLRLGQEEYYNSESIEKTIQRNVFWLAFRNENNDNLIDEVLCNLSYVDICYPTSRARQM